MDLLAFRCFICGPFLAIPGFQLMKCLSLAYSKGGIQIWAKCELLWLNIAEEIPGAAWHWIFAGFFQFQIQERNLNLHKNNYNIVVGRNTLRNHTSAAFFSGTSHRFFMISVRPICYILIFLATFLHFSNFHPQKYIHSPRPAATSPGAPKLCFPLRRRPGDAAARGPTEGAGVLSLLEHHPRGFFWSGDFWVIFGWINFHRSVFDVWLEKRYDKPAEKFFWKNLEEMEGRKKKDIGERKAVNLHNSTVGGLSW